MVKSYYQTLGVSADSEDIVIRAAYKAMMLKYHPDQNRDDPQAAEAKAKAMTEAYSVLSNPTRRANYDASRRPRNASTGQKSKGSQGGKSRSGENGSRTSSPPPPPPPEPPQTSRPETNSTTTNQRRYAPYFLLIVLLFILVGIFGNSIGARTAKTPAQGDATTTPIAPPEESQTAVTPIPLNKAVHWSADGDGNNPKKFQVGDLSLTLRSDFEPNASGPQPIPVIAFEKPGLPPFERKGVKGFSVASADLLTAEFEKGVRATLFMTFSGGAHCCTQIDIIKATPKGWVAIDGGQWDGGPLSGPVLDLNGDGRLDLVLADDRFAYAFAAYAESIMPPRIFNLVGSKLVDVSTSATFATVFREAMTEAQVGCAMRKNGACAAFVASAARLGLRDWAWDIMLASYDRRVDPMWLPTACATARVSGACPKGDEIVFEDFPHALDWFLGDIGYAQPQFAIVAVGPSFDCRKAQSPVLNLVCVSKELSALDRQMAVAYAGAISSSLDAAALRSAQLAWLQLRDGSPPNETAIAQMYRSRIASLSGGG